MSSRDTVIQTLRAHQQELERLGVVHAAIFGSVARGDDRPDSDVDVMVDVDPTRVRSIISLGRIQSRLEKVVGRRVDLAQRGRLRPHVAVEAERDAVHAF